MRTGDGVSIGTLCFNMLNSEDDLRAQNHLGLPCSKEELRSDETSTRITQKVRRWCACIVCALCLRVCVTKCAPTRMVSVCVCVGAWVSVRCVRTRARVCVCVCTRVEPMGSSIK